MKKNALVTMAALAVMFYSVSAFAAAATCTDWVGSWNFTYDNATVTKICFDNASIENGTFTLCDNDSAANCQCLDNITSQQICVDNTTFEQCNNDSIAGCTCVDNPFYRTPGGPNGVQAVTIATAVNTLTFQGHSVPCLAQGTRGTTPVNIVQIDNATAIKYGLANLTYLVFEGSSFDNVTFTQILPENFTKTDTATNFTAETDLNSLGLVSGIKSDNATPTCALTVIPKTFSKVTALVDPIQPFIIRAERSGAIEFSKLQGVDWNNSAISSFIRIRLGNKLIFGFNLVRPLQLVPDDYSVTVTYGSPETTACAPYTVK